MSGAIPTREELRAKLTATVAHLLSQTNELTVESLLLEIEADIGEFITLGVEIGLKAALGDDMGGLAFADLIGTADASNAELIRRRLTPQAVSKVCCRVRRNLGLPLRVPGNSRAGLKPKTP